MKDLPWLTLAFSALAVTVHFIPALTLGWQFDRAALANGEAWRFITAHLTHFSTDHLRWDLLAFAVLGAMAERLSRRTFLVTLALSSVIITLGVWLAQPQFATYRGLSGIDCALFGVVVTDLLAAGRRERHGFSIAVGSIALAGFVVKCLIELATGDTVFVETAGAFAPVPLAHLLGLAVGIVTVRSARQTQKRRAPSFEDSHAVQSP